MKKKIIYALSLALLVGPVVASVEMTNYTPTDEAVTVDITKKEKEKVKEIKELFNITEAYEDFNLIKDPINSDSGSTYLNNKAKNKTIDSYQWSDENLGNLQVAYTSDGDFYSYSKWSKDQDDNKNSKKISKDQAQKIVEEKLAKLIPDFDKKYKLRDFSFLDDGKELNFLYERLIHGIPLASDSLYVNISLTSKEIGNMEINSDFGPTTSFLSDKDFKNKAKLSQEKAEKIFREKFPLRLSYKISNDGKSVAKVYHSEIFDIDAEDGKLVKNNNLGLMPYEMDKAANAEGLTDVEIKKIEGLKDLSKKSQAKKKAYEIAGDGYQVTSISLNSDKENFYYNISLEKDKNYGRLTLNARNLNLISLDLWTDKKVYNNKLKEADAKKLALGFLEKYGDKKELNLDKISIDSSKMGTSVTIPRYVNKLPVLKEGVKIFVDQNKKISSYERTSTKIDFSKASDNSLTQEEANKIFLSSKNFGLKYVMTNKGPKLFYGNIRDFAPVIGQDKILRDYNGEIINFKEQISYSDLNKARDKEAILYLKDLGIGLIGRKLSDKINYQDFVKLLNAPNRMNSSYIDNFGLDLEKLKGKNILEKDVVKTLVTKNNLERFTKAKGIFKEDIFKNQKSLGDYESYYIIAKGFAYINGDIDPNKEMTLEEVLYLIYNSMK
ncbi:YcdB/YcdC domain-containing protein [Peptoniphilus sp. DNF00840]|uniref:YcdB/YcdC domain-containing protein n=1 Tax=Peptoniphilus sp. DNF00840 TaxID=1477000 RepID=UPI000781D0B4|nr:YcdB/YcdC domain-containing protein [Peptoniphilus sp. DNF00840]KXB70425.1 peptidase propeptide and YPEB domain protein [Peptoniphilus sp. DNF00840]